jgi:hypothetical protein
MSELCDLKAATVVELAARKKFDDSVIAARDAQAAAEVARKELNAASEARETALAAFLKWLPTETALCPPLPSATESV